jgi:hypothetical protein
MNTQVIVGLVELFAYWGTLYALAGTWWLDMSVWLMDKLEDLL